MKFKEKTNIKVIKYLLNTVVKNKPLVLINYIISFLLCFVTLFRTIFLPKEILEEIIYIYNGENIGIHLKKIIIYIIISVTLYLIIELFKSFISNYKFETSEWFTDYFRGLILNKVFSLNYSMIENSDIASRIERAKDGITKYYGENVYGVLDNFFNILNNLGVLILTSFVLIKTSPLLLLFHCLFIIIKSVFLKKIKDLEVSQFQKRAESNRLFAYLFFEITDYSYGKDIRLYNSSSFFNEKAQEHLTYQQELWLNTAKGKRKENGKIIFFDICDTILSYCLLSWKAFRKIISIGDLTIGISSSISFFDASQNIALSFQEIIKKEKYISEYIELMEINIEDGKLSLLENKKKHTIEFKNVWFKYSTSNDYVLENVSFIISEGEKIAIVGLNGAGKSTLIKLLCRFYKPTKGEILYDGINIQLYKDEDYKRLFSGIFQDFNIFAFSVEDNICCSEHFDEQKFSQVISDSNFDDDMNKLKNGKNTILSSLFELDGIELSGGQKQKIAFARALYKDAQVLILDEPTSSMDPISEAKLYHDFNKIAKQKTTIFISHRLASCKFCDTILVIDNKKIVEYGTHDELMKKNNLYAQLFLSQKAAFK